MFVRAMLAVAAVTDNKTNQNRRIEKPRDNRRIDPAAAYITAQGVACECRSYYYFNKPARKRVERRAIW